MKERNRRQIYIWCMSNREEPRWNQDTLQRLNLSAFLVQLIRIQTGTSLNLLWRVPLASNGSSPSSPRASRLISLSSPVKLWLLCKLLKSFDLTKFALIGLQVLKGFYCFTFCPGLLCDWYEQLWQFPWRHRWTTTRWQLWVGLWLLKWQPSVYTNTHSLTLYEEDDDFSAGWTKAAWASWWNILPEVIVLF